MLCTLLTEAHALCGLQVCPRCCKEGRWGDEAKSWHVHNELPEQSSAVHCDECAASVAFRPADAATRSRASARASAPAAAPAVAPSAAPATATDECRFFFVDAARLLDFEGAIMPHYQQLLRAHPGTRARLAHA